MNEEKFLGKATLYAKFRPTYPTAAIDYLYTAIGFDENCKIADIGAGTGILSNLLLQRGSAVVCVEPNDDMLATAKQALSDHPKVQFVKASAEQTMLQDHSVDFITVAQAFHWFDRRPFRAECDRILKKGGKVVLLWNHQAHTDTIRVEMAEINRRFCPDFKGFSGGSAQHADAYTDFFKDGLCTYKTFPNDLYADENNFIGRCLSSSYAPKEDSPLYTAYLAALRTLFNTHSKDGLLVMPNKTHLYIGE